MRKNYDNEESFTCQHCGCDYPLGMMDYEKENVCIFCVEDDERFYSEQD